VAKSGREKVLVWFLNSMVNVTTCIVRIQAKKHGSIRLRKSEIGYRNWR
jgi:hypothetical protein